MRRVWCGAGYAGVAVACTLFVATQALSSRPGPQSELRIHVWKTQHEMWLQDGDRILRKFTVALGREPTAGKVMRGDGRTPQGRYYVCEKRPQSRFHRFLAISYPNIDDAERAFAEHLITADEWADIFVANVRQTQPPWSTPLGGDVGIHGYGGRRPIAADWTKGCIAVSDADIDYLYDRVPLGTPVIISE
jgi:murein L,D-transpeptidase YafK